MPEDKNMSAEIPPHITEAIAREEGRVKTAQEQLKNIKLGPSRMVMESQVIGDINDHKRLGIQLFGEFKLGQEPVNRVTQPPAVGITEEEATRHHLPDVVVGAIEGLKDEQEAVVERMVDARHKGNLDKAKRAQRAFKEISIDRKRIAQEHEIAKDNPINKSRAELIDRE